MTDRIRQISDHGQSLWLDYISRNLLRSGELRARINGGVTGMTSNPTIFHEAIATGDEYDEQIRELAKAGKSTYEIYEALAIRDIQDAADQLRSIYDATSGRDGFVSLEVDPKLAGDTAGTVSEARRLHQAVDRQNLMIKVPATRAGIPAIRTLISERINVNVTLIFSISAYEDVIDAYMEGLRDARRAGHPIGYVASVASFFVSRVDTLVDRILTERIEQGEAKLGSLRGQAAIANAKIAYDRFKSAFGSGGFEELRTSGARVQRPLWASTSTKNPNYPPTKYVDALIGPDTVNTLPPHTLDAARDYANVARTIDLDVEEAHALVRTLGGAGIDMNAVTDELLTDGVKKFADSFDKLMQDLEKKRSTFA